MSIRVWILQGQCHWAHCIGLTIDMSSYTLTLYNLTVGELYKGRHSVPCIAQIYSKGFLCHEVCPLGFTNTIAVGAGF